MGKNSLLPLFWQNYKQSVEMELTTILAGESILHEAMRYATLDGGKRIRALLVMVGYAALSNFSLDKCKNSSDFKNILMAASAVEMIHAYSLIHDDLPCMDDDAMRRNRPSTHIAFGEAQALLAGDALQTQAFYLLSTLENAHLSQKLLQMLTFASGVNGMCAGQSEDMQQSHEKSSQGSLINLEAMHLKKTGALLRAALFMGYEIAKKSPLNNTVEYDISQILETFAKSIGLGFQVVDDYLDATQTSEQMGKTAGKDAEQNKLTYVSQLGIDGTKNYAQTLKTEASLCLKQANLNADAKVLWMDILRLVFERNH